MASFRVRDAGVTKRSKRIRVNDGGTVKTAKSIRIRDGGITKILEQQLQSVSHSQDTDILLNTNYVVSSSAVGGWGDTSGWTYQWTKISGTGSLVGSTTGSTVTVNSPTNGTMSLKISITDTSGMNKEFTGDITFSNA